MNGPSYDINEEDCPNCGQETAHHVRLQLREESESYGGNQPYRLSECQICGHQREERIGQGSEQSIND